MTERLSDALHLEAARIPAIQRQPGQVRRAAERHRRIRRGGAVAVVAVTAALAVASLVTGPWGNTARPAPADGPGPNVTGTSMFSLAAAPTLTEADWEKITGGGTHKVYRLSSPPKVLNRCAPDPRAYRSPTDAYGAAYRQPDRGRQEHLTEYVMRYADEAAAAGAYFDVWFNSLGCATPFGDSSQVLQQNWPRAYGDLEDEAFFFQRPSTESGGYYHLTAARDRNVVIVVVSTGWRERPVITVQIALMRAIPNERGKCRTFCAP
jgi:hypothetical protein